MAFVLAPLVHLIQGCIELGAKMLVLSSSFLLVLQLGVAVVMLIVALCGQSIDCKPNVVGLGMHGGSRNIYVGFSCWWVNCKLWVLSVV